MTKSKPDNSGDAVLVPKPPIKRKWEERSGDSPTVPKPPIKR